MIKYSGTLIYKSTYTILPGGFTINSQILTSREREIFDLLAKSDTTRDIAEKLDISEKTVRNHISNVIQKLGLESRTQALLELIRLKEITL